MIEALTDRKVLAFLSQAHVEPDLTIEIFLTDGPLAGFGALELVDPQPRNHGTAITRDIVVREGHCRPSARLGGDAAQCHQPVAQFLMLSSGVANSFGLVHINARYRSTVKEVPLSAAGARSSRAGPRRARPASR
jgi:hypothetical protein